MNSSVASDPLHGSCLGRHCRGVLALLLAAVAAGPAWGAGFYVTEVGTPGSLGTAGIGNSTNRRGPDTSWTNPAGMFGMKERAVIGGLSIAVPKIEFSPTLATAGGDDGGNAGVLAPIPGAFFVQPLGDDWRLGIAFSAPLGGGFDFGDNFVGRYTVQELEMVGAGVSTSLAYRFNDRFSLGAGLSLVYTRYSQDIALNQGPLPDGKIKIEDADDFGLQPFVGMQWQITDRVRLGAVYRAEFDAELKGDVKVENLLSRFNPSGAVNLDWTNPQWLDVGLHFSVREDLEVMIAGGWQEWSEFSANRLAVSFPAGLAAATVLNRNFDDTFYVGGAVQKTLSNGALLSAGIKYDSSPVDDADRTLDLPFDEVWTFSLSYAWEGRGNLDYGLGTSLLYMGDGAVDQTSQGVRVAGEFDTNLILFVGGGLRYRF